MPLNFQQKKRFAQCRLGILPIRHHTGRFEKLPEAERICKRCNINQCDDIEHFMLICPFYNQERITLFSEIVGFTTLDADSNLGKLGYY